MPNKFQFKLKQTSKFSSKMSLRNCDHATKSAHVECVNITLYCLIVTLCEVEHSSGSSLRRLQQALAGRVFSYTSQNARVRQSHVVQRFLLADGSLRLVLLWTRADSLPRPSHMFVAVAAGVGRQRFPRALHHVQLFELLLQVMINPVLDERHFPYVSSWWQRRAKCAAEMRQSDLSSQ